MAPTPLTVATKVECTSSSGNDKVYHGIVSEDWCIGKVPNGGFSLGLLLHACIQYQSLTSHPDPINVTAHYLQVVHTVAFEVRVRTLKTGKAFSNILADLVQKGRTRISAHIVFGVLAPSPTSLGPRLTLSPPSSYARRHPLHTHPSTATPVALRSTWAFSSLARWAPDPVYSDKNKLDNPNRTDSLTVGGGGLEWAAWFELTSEKDLITTPALCLCADIFLNIPELLPKTERDGLGASWFPTMVLNIDFKFPIPQFSSDHASRTVGLYSSGQYMNDPQGRHSQYTEVWTAPCNLGEGEVVDGWRDKQVCLATSTQMALVIPMEINHERSAKL